MDLKKKEYGQFYTIKNPFHHNLFKDWLSLIPNIESQIFLEPFAGINNITRLIEDVGINNKWNCFDIDKRVVQENSNPRYPIVINDSLVNYPKSFKVAITNPPYLAKNSAKRRGLPYPDTHFNDLYKLSLHTMLENTDYIGAIIPESFITQGIFHERLYGTISLLSKMFDDTDCPVCLAFFIPEKQKQELFDIKKDFHIYHENDFVGNYIEVKNKLITTEETIKLQFNNKEGQIGLMAIDGTKEPSIRFTPAETIKEDEVKQTSRSKTRIFIEDNGIEIDREKLIAKCNNLLFKHREDTNDIFLTTFKGLRKDGRYRRRLDFKQARQIINQAIQELH